jgi:hypothetical protein
MRLRAAAVVPPIKLLPLRRIWMPIPFPKSCVPAALVPMKLPWIVLLEAAFSRMSIPTAAPAMTLPCDRVAPREGGDPRHGHAELDVAGGIRADVVPLICAPPAPRSR